MIDKATFEAVLAALNAGQKEHVMPDGGFAVALPHGYHLEKVPALEPPLKRIRQNVTMHDRESFIEYVECFKGDATRIFAEPGFLASGGAHVTAVFDYHKPETEPDRCAHTARYAPRYSEQWKRWTGATAAFNQAEFAEFIEENRSDIREPAAANLLDLVRTFKANKKVAFNSVVYQRNGDLTLGYEEVTDKASSTVVPEALTLGIPVHFRGPIYAVPVFIRYRVGSGGVAFSLKVDRADVIEDDAFQKMTDEIEQRVTIPVYLGRNS